METNNYSLQALHTSTPPRKAQFAVQGTSLIGMIRARKLAIKLKKRAQFLVADKRRRENTGKAILVHHDIPENSSGDGRLFFGSEQHLITYSGDRVVGRATAGETREHKTTPDDIFPSLSIEEDITRMLQARLDGVKYNPATCKELSKSLSDQIKQDTKAHHPLARYKLICVVSVGEAPHQNSARFGSRCLWNAKFDNFASSFYQNSHIFAIATIYGVYCE